MLLVIHILKAPLNPKTSHVYNFSVVSVALEMGFYYLLFLWAPYERFDSFAVCYSWLASMSLPYPINPISKIRLRGRWMNEWTLSHLAMPWPTGLIFWDEGLVFYISMGLRIKDLYVLSKENECLTSPKNK